MAKKAEPAKKSETAKASPKPAAKKPKTTAAAKTAKPSAPRKKAASKADGKSVAVKKNTRPAISRDEIARRAYFISEKRHRLGLHGDSAQDWLQAEQELIGETPAK